MLLDSIRSLLGFGSDVPLTRAERDRVTSIYLFLMSDPATHLRVARERGVLVRVFAGVFVLLVFTAIMVVLGVNNAVPPWVVAPVIMAMSMGFAFWSATMQRRPVRHAWRTAMRAAGHDVCLQCGYWLARRAADSTRCPECGMEDRHQVVVGWPPRAAPLPEEEPPDPSGPDGPSRMMRDFPP